MPSPTSRLRLMKIDPGSDLNVWGQRLNENVFDLLDEAAGGVERITLTGNVALSSANYATDQARNAGLVFQGSPATDCTVTIPAVEKVYVVSNTTARVVTLTAGGASAAVPAGDRAVIWCDGTDCGFGSVTEARVNGLIAAAVLTPGQLPAMAANAGKFLGTDGAAPLWQAIPSATVGRRAVTAAATVVGADRGKLIDCAPGGYTLALEAAAVLGAGWYAWARNGGPGDVTVDPAGAETVNGAATLTLRPGDAALLTSDGAAIRAVLSIAPGLVLLSAQTVTGAVASVLVTGVFSTEFDDYQVIVDGVQSSVTTANELRAQMTVGGVAQSAAASYRYAGLVVAASSGAPGALVNDAGTSFGLSGATTYLSDAAHVSMTITRPAVTGAARHVLWHAVTRFDPSGVGTNATVQFVTAGGRWTNTAAAADGMAFSLASGNITAGTFRVYGVRKG